LNVELYIAKRIHFTRKGKKNISRPAVRISTLAIAIGLAVMLVSVAVLVGFKQEIRNKVIGFGSHIQITNFDSNSTYETHPISVSDSLLQSLATTPRVLTTSRFCTKPGIIKTKDDFQGIVVKGVEKGYDWTFFKKNLQEGELLTLSDTVLRNEVIVSQYLANLLQIKVGDSFLTYFVQDNVRARKFKVIGIYSTNFLEYDKLFILTDMRHVQSLNNWEKDQVTGVEIQIDDFSRLDEVDYAIYSRTANKFDKYGASYYTQTIRDLNPHIFSWLDILDMNVVVILVLMLAVAVFNMISGLLILILERTNMIGILKAMGTRNWSIRKIFLYQSFFLIGKGLLWGNVIGIAVILIQYFTGIIPLDPDIYYVSTVPVSINLWHIVLLNIGTLVCSLLILILPSYLITKIVPAKAIHFE
jgi:lipoprotein-releasing system permease protein